MRYCDVPGCENIHKARGYCKKHYMQQYNRYYRMRFPEKVKATKVPWSDMTPEQRERQNKAKRDWMWMLPTDKKEKIRAKGLERTRKRYKRLKEEGLCTVCSKHPVVGNHIRCEACHEQHLANGRKRYKEGKTAREEDVAWWT